MRDEASVVLIDDSDEDWEVLRELFARTGSQVPLTRCIDEVTALAHLRDACAAGKPPALVLLDLNLGPVDGRDLLKTLKRDETLRTIAVCVLSTSDNPRDVAACYAAGANAYLCKPVDLDALSRMVRLIREFWLETVVRPGRPSSHGVPQ